jgi:tRNA threonylcarbamoyladenosine biosynthesis protein TsaB
LKILALDTSTEFCSAALLLDGETLTRATHAGQRHSELLLPMVEYLLQQSDTTLTALDAIAFGEGPGSFTGLRIVCGVTQGLALGADLPVVGISTLHALARAAKQTWVVSCIDARMGEIYWASHRVDEGRVEQLQETELCKPDSAPPLEGDGWCGCGSGFDAYEAVLQAHYRGQVGKTVRGLYPHASDIAALAVAAVKSGKSVAPEHALPVYVRDKVALKINER